MDLKEKLGSLKNQQEQARELFIKCQGAIEFLESEIKEQESSNDKTEKDKKEVKK